MGERLNRWSLAKVPTSRRPRPLPRPALTRIAHFGAGAFALAHPAVYTEGVNAARGEDWGVVAVARRDSPTVQALAEQDGLYSVTELSGDPAGATRVIGCVTEAIGAWANPDRLARLFADPDLSVVTATLTEKGYCRRPGTQALDVGLPEVAADLAAAQAAQPPGATVVGSLAHHLAGRFRAGGAPISIVSCDNLAGNGLVFQGVIRDFVARSGWADRDRILDWLGDCVAFPQTIVDRITPATTERDRLAAERALGVRDEVSVVCEPYRQWVLEDRFAAARPTWEADGALVVDDVRPYQLMKLRLLNGSHSALAYLGLATGRRTVSDAMATSWGEPLVRRLCAEVAPTIGGGAQGYVESLVARFGNAAVEHRLRQIGSDGSLKVPERWLAPLRELRARDAATPTLELALAAWARSTRPDAYQSWGTTDPAASDLASAWAGTGTATTVAALLRRVGAADLAEDHELTARIAARVPAIRAGVVDL